MTPIQIAYFKHFLFDRGLQYHYIGNYRGRKQKGNPESLEEFLQEASPAKAIMGAFYFKMNSDYGFDYWNDVKEKWLAYLNLNVEKIMEIKKWFKDLLEIIVFVGFSAMVAMLGVMCGVWIFCTILEKYFG